jgi:hypothetical protein
VSDQDLPEEEQRYLDNPEEEERELQKHLAPQRPALRTLTLNQKIVLVAAIIAGESDRYVIDAVVQAGGHCTQQNVAYYRRNPLVRELRAQQMRGILEAGFRRRATRIEMYDKLLQSCYGRALGLPNGSTFEDEEAPTPIPPPDEKFSKNLDDVLKIEARLDSLVSVEYGDVPVMQNPVAPKMGLGMFNDVLELLLKQAEAEALQQAQDEPLVVDVKSIEP